MSIYDDSNSLFLTVQRCPLGKPKNSAVLGDNVIEYLFYDISLFRVILDGGSRKMGPRPPMTKIPPNLSDLSTEELVDLAVQCIEDDAIFWLATTRPYAKEIRDLVEAKMPERHLYMHSPPPDWDFAIVDLGWLENWMDWIDKHAAHRSRLKERGVPYHQLPPLPKGIVPSEPTDDD